MATTIYGLLNTANVGDIWKSADCDLMNNTAEFFYVNSAELTGSGIYKSTDFNGTIVGGALTVQVSSGRGFIGGSGSLKLVYNANAINVTGLTATSDNYVFLKQDGTFTFTAVTIGAGAPATPANTHLVCMATTNGTQATSINNNPTGRNNIAFVLVGSNNNFSGQNTFSNATAPIIVAKIGPTSGQQHALPAVASDTIALLGANQTFSGQETFSNGTAPIISAKIGPTSGQQHALPAVASDTLAVLAANQTFTGQESFTNGTAPIITAKLGPSSTQQHTLPVVASDTVTLLAATQTLTGKTLTSPVINTDITSSGATMKGFGKAARKVSAGTTVTPSATANTFGTPVTYSPTAGYYCFTNFMFIDANSTGTFGSETLTMRFTAVYSDATTANITHTFTATGVNYVYIVGEIFGLFTDNKIITSVQVDCKSTIASSTATGNSRMCALQE